VIKQYPLVAQTSLTGDETIETRVLETGTGNDVAICVHGVGSRADRFRPVLEPLAAAGYHVYALDLPGHGFATKTPLPLSVPFYAEFVAGISEQIDADRVTLVGTSLGGHIGGFMTRLDGRAPDRLVMVGTLGVVPLPEDEGVNISRVILRNRTVDDCAGKLRALLWDDERVTPEWAQEESLINNSQGADQTFRRLGQYFENGINGDLVLDDLRDHADTVEMGLMWGDRDVIVSVDTGRQCMDALPDLPMAWIRDTGHAPYWERPEAFVQGMEMLFDSSLRPANEYTV
jgi:2-hydroxy-6-oxonona-2,4-dienedioate hydrolase